MLSWTIEMFDDHFLAFELTTILGAFARAFMPAKQFSLAPVWTNHVGHVIRATTTDFMEATCQELLDSDGTLEASAVVATSFSAKMFTCQASFARRITKHFAWVVRTQHRPFVPTR